GTLLRGVSPWARRVVATVVDDRHETLELLLNDAGGAMVTRHILVILRPVEALVQRVKDNEHRRGALALSFQFPDHGLLILYQARPSRHDVERYLLVGREAVMNSLRLDALAKAPGSLEGEIDHDALLDAPAAIFPPLGKM